MKFFVAFAAFVAVATANTMINPVPTNIFEELQAIVAAIHDPNTEPITAGLLEHLLQHILAAKPEPVEVGPAIVDFPIPVEATPEAPVQPVQPVQPVLPVQPSPVVVGPLVPGAPVPLVQIIVNVKSPADSAAVPVAPVAVPEVPVADPVIVVDAAESEAIVVEPVVVDPVVVATPIIPEAVVILPDQLN